MDIRSRISNAFKALTRNNLPLSDGRALARDFRRRGNQGAIMSDWSRTIISDEDMYTGYAYAAINNRANSVAQLATNNLMTLASPTIMDAAKANEDPVYHPYLEILDNSDTFSNYKFWYDISTYLDLEGVYYLLAMRNKSGRLTGAIQEFKLLNPFNIKRVVNETTRELGGYVEQRDGLIREIPKHMIIEIRRLNPFSTNDPYSMADAARDSQFTLKSSSDYTRHAISKNTNSPGIITIDDDELALDPQKFENFKSRILGKVKGEPIFGTGKGAITYDDMQTDLNKTALDKVNEVNLNALIAVSGNSKTTFGIEQSGVTRDTASIQMDLFIANHTLPQLQLIIDALNQDYKTFYEVDYERDNYRMIIDNPLGVDKEIEIKDNQIRKEQFELRESLIAKGYDRELASKYVQGEIEIMDLGEPTEEPEPTTEPAEEPVEENNALKTVNNQLDPDEQGVVTQHQGTLENAVKNIEIQASMMVMKKVVKNKFDDESDIINKTDRRQLEAEMKQALESFYLVIIPLYAKRTMNRRMQEFQKLGVFNMNTEVKNYIRVIASKTSASHLDTIFEDLRNAVQKAAFDGASQQELINAITSEYTEISKNRAKAIARTETNRAFTQSQFQADKQFLKENKLTGQAYKQWVTTSDNPCAICQELASRPPVPFKQDFVEFGSELAVTYEADGKTRVLKQKFDYEPLEAGNAHVNCGCKYRLIVE